MGTLNDPKKKIVFKVEKFNFVVNMVSPSQTVWNGIQQQLINSKLSLPFRGTPIDSNVISQPPMHYKISDFAVNSISIPSQQKEFTIGQHTLSQTPCRAYFLLISENRLLGDPKLNSLSYYPYGLTKFRFFMNNEKFELNMNTKEPENMAQVFFQNIRSLPIYDQAVCFDPESLADGFFVMVFDTTGSYRYVIFESPCHVSAPNMSVCILVPTVVSSVPSPVNQPPGLVISSSVIHLLSLYS